MRISDWSSECALPIYEPARDPHQICVDERLDRRPEQPEQYADEQEGKGPAGEAGPQEGRDIHVNEAGGNGQQLERDRRRALHQDDLGAIVAQVTGRGRKTVGEPEHAEQPQPDAFIEEIADPIAQADRTSVVWGKKVSVRLDTGGRS